MVAKTRNSNIKTENERVGRTTDVNCHATHAMLRETREYSRLLVVFTYAVPRRLKTEPCVRMITPGLGSRLRRRVGRVERKRC